MFKMQMSIETDNHEKRKMLQLIESAFFENWILSIETINSIFLAK